MLTIDRFSGQHRFLSNFCPSPMTITVPIETDLGRAINQMKESQRTVAIEYDHPAGCFYVIVETVEHGFQSDKAAIAIDQLAVLRSDGAAAAKSRGRRVQLREDWDSVKLDVMRKWLRLKFALPSFRDALIATGDAELIEGNTWNDTYWGCVRRGDAWVGQNHLGRLLMEIRAGLSAVSSVP